MEQRCNSNNNEGTRTGTSNGTKRTINTGTNISKEYHHQQVPAVMLARAASAAVAPVVKCHRTAKAVLLVLHLIMMRKHQNKKSIKLAYSAPTHKIMCQHQNALKKERLTVVSFVE